MAVAARLDGVTKSYRLGSERSNARALVPGPWGERAGGTRFHALDDVTLDIQQGRCLGILGPNGAGKSTLLKVLAGLIRPTEGRVEVNGRMAAIIELGLGFMPDLSGADNLRFACSLLGMSSKETERRFGDIVDFAGIGPFMDTPLKRYSTGMKARLGFAIVSSVDADIVVIDEVLSVGDWEFQQRSFERVRELHRSGATVIAVSHSHWMISQLCDEAILMEQGRVVASGDPLQVIERYIGPETSTDPDKDPDLPVLQTLIAPEVPGTVRVRELELCPSEIRPNDPLRFRFVLEVDEPVDAQLVMSIYTMGRAVFAEREEGPSEILAQPGEWEVSAEIPRLPFASGRFTLRVAVVRGHSADDHLQEHAGALATASANLNIVGKPSTRPGLLLETAWDATPLDHVRSGRGAAWGA